MEALIFDIQRFSLHDGPGVRTTVFFKGCSLACRWCQNPESHRGAPEMAFYAERCLGCFECEKACPSGGIQRDGTTRIDFSRCTACARCADACPAEALRLIGRRWSAPALTGELARDLDFFTSSGGGVTLSGGEPLLQSGFIAELAPLLKERGIHITLETAGHAPFANFEKIKGLIDLIYFDLKLIDSARHRKATGAGNETIIANFIKLARGPWNMQPRIPIVTGINDDEANIMETARLVKRAGLSSIHCLPWHGLGNSKLSRIRTQARPFEAAAPDRAKMHAIQELFLKEEIDALIYD